MAVYLESTLAMIAHPNSVIKDLMCTIVSGITGHDSVHLLILSLIYSRCRTQPRACNVDKHIMRTPTRSITTDYNGNGCILAITLDANN